MTIRSLVTEKGATVVDVRGTWEFEDGQVDGALNIPLDEIPMRIEEMKNLKMPLVVYCRSGNRANKAKAMLEEAGLKNITNLGAWENIQCK